MARRFGTTQNAKKAVFGAMVLLALGACGHQHQRYGHESAQSGIIGGTPVQDADPIAGMTAMLIDAKAGALCTVSILSNEWLLTAGHCVAGTDPNNLYVIFSGTFQDLLDHKTPKTNIRKVKAAYPNPNYALTMQKINDMAAAAKAAGKQLTGADIDGIKSWGDIALIHISGTIPSFKVAASFLPTGTGLRVNETVTLAGYGQTGSSDDASYGTLNRVDVQIVDPAWGNTEVVIDNTTKGACHGDSGGPAYATVGGKLFLFGVTSHGSGDAATEQCLHKTVYTNAMQYQDWIKQTISSNN